MQKHFGGVSPFLYLCTSFLAASAQTSLISTAPNMQLSDTLEPSSLPSAPRTSSAEMGEVSVRNATPDDAAALLDIYVPYVKKTAITFELEIPSVEVFRSRIVKTQERFPYLVAERCGRIVGYAYVGTFKDRAAYDHCVETSIYVAEGERGGGVGTTLYAALEKRMPEIGVTNLNACIAYAAVEDEFLDNRSEAFHSRLGYTKVAHFHRCGFKFRRYYDMIWMEKILSKLNDNN